MYSKLYVYSDKKKWAHATLCRPLGPPMMQIILFHYVLFTCNSTNKLSNAYYKP